MTTRSHARRKVVFAMAALGAALTLPGAAVAEPPKNHHTCDPSAASACPAFEVTTLFGVQNPSTSDYSALTFQFGQPDRRMPVMRADYYIPNGFGFSGLSNLDPAKQSDGITPATSCSDIYSAAGGLEGKAEALSSATSMRAIVGAARNDPDEIDQALIATGAFTAFGGDTYDFTQNRSVTFLDWDGTTARLCYLNRNATITTDYGIGGNLVRMATLTRLPGDPNFSWRLSLDVSDIYKDATFRDEVGSILKQDITLAEQTFGNWNRDETTGELSTVPFARTPDVAGNYAFHGVFSTCAGGLDQSTPTGCKDIGAAGSADDFTSTSLDQVVQISPPASNIRHDFGKITGPLTPALCLNPYCPLGLVTGQNGFDVTWQEPQLPPGSGVKGYVLVIAEPGKQNTRYFRRIVTNAAYSGDPNYSATACSGGTCTTNITFPLQSTDGSYTLLGDGKYDMGLITMYTDTIRRSDSRCDDGTGPGASCAPSVPRIRVLEPTISLSQVIIRPDDFPLRFIEHFDDNNGTCNCDPNRTFDPVTNRVLLVNFTMKRAEMIIWNTNGLPTIMHGSSNGIIGDNSLGGITNFASPAIAGATKNWQIAGVVDGGITGEAVGALAIYDLKNPGLQPPAIAGLPTTGNPGLCSEFFGFITFNSSLGECMTYEMAAF
jgi:hypothetical protein